MYYHLITKDGLKYKDLKIEEIEKILREEEVSYNNARIYSSEKKLNEVYENYKEELIEEGEDTSFENIKIEKLISMAETKNDLQNNSYKFDLVGTNYEITGSDKAFGNNVVIIGTDLKKDKLKTLFMN